jgi:hypothetical protein
MITNKIFLKDLFYMMSNTKYIYIYIWIEMKNNIIYKKTKKKIEKTNELDHTLASDEHVLIKYY